MPPETVMASQMVDLKPEDRESKLMEIPAVAARMIHRVFYGLEAQNPFLKPQLERTKRRLLALNQLELHALRAGVWKDNKHSTMDQALAKVEGMLSDPTRLIENLDGRLTWIEGATDAQLASEATLAPPVALKIEEMAYLASAKLPAKPIDVDEAQRAFTEAFFGMMACSAPAKAERLERMKQRFLALGMARRMAVKAAYWTEMHGKNVEDLIQVYEALFNVEDSKLAELEQRLDEAEALSSQAVEEKLASLPKITRAMLEHREKEAAAT